MRIITPVKTQLEPPLRKAVLLDTPAASTAWSRAFLPGFFGIVQGGTHEAILWPPAAAEMWSAIAGLRGSHDAPPAGASGGAGPGRGRRRTALLLEGPVTLARARKAAASAAPRNWIVERARSVRIGPAGLHELRELGIRWSVIEPVEVVALAASPLLARARARWARMLPAGTTVWPIGSG